MSDEIYTTLAYGLTNLTNHKYKMSYNEIPNILVDSVSLSNKSLSNLEIIDAAKKLSLYKFRESFLRDTLPFKHKIKRMWYFKFRFIFW